MLGIEITLALLLAIALIGALAKWLPIPLPLLLIAGGVVFSFVPGFESLHIDPAIFFLLFFPQLLFADSWIIPKGELRDVLRPVLLFAFGLVFLTVIVVGCALQWLIPALPLAVDFALGAIVSPTAAAFEFVLLACGGVVVGLLFAWVFGQVRPRLQLPWVNDPPIQTIISVLTPFAAYLLAEQLHVSGILAVVAAGLFAGHAANAQRRTVLAENFTNERRLSLAAIDAQREKLQELRETDVINEQTLRLIEVDLDHAELLASPEGRRAR